MTTFILDMTPNGAAAWGLRRAAACCSVWPAPLKWLRVTILLWGIHDKVAVGSSWIWSFTLIKIIHSTSQYCWMEYVVCVCVYNRQQFLASLRYFWVWPDNIYRKQVILLISLDAQALMYLPQSPLLPLSLYSQWGSLLPCLVSVGCWSALQGPWENCSGKTTESLCVLQQLY